MEFSLNFSMNFSMNFSIHFSMILYSFLYSFPYSFLFISIRFSVHFSIRFSMNLSSFPYFISISYFISLFHLHLGLNYVSILFYRISSLSSLLSRSLPTTPILFTIFLALLPLWSILHLANPENPRLDEALPSLTILSHSSNLELQRSAALTFAEVTEKGTVPINLLSQFPSPRIFRNPGSLPLFSLPVMVCFLRMFEPFPILLEMQ